MDKRRKDVLVLKHNVEESIRRFKDYEEEKQQEHLRKKQEIEKRIADRKSRAFEREKINKVSDIIIKELNSYKISLPDIYTRNKQNEIEVVPLLLTGLDEEQIRTIDSKSDRGKAFL
jgi:outer membrane protein assembly factor BamA